MEAKVSGKQQEKLDMQAKVRKVVIIMTDEFQLKLKLNFCIITNMF